jgi:transcriptional regulator with XRE-family HTH domain
MNKGDFAKAVGISVRMLTALYASERNPGRAVLQKLLERFPEKQDKILSVFLLGNEHSCSKLSPSVPTTTEATA